MGAVRTRVERVGRREIAYPLLVVGGGAAIAVALLYFGVIRTGIGQEIDQSAYEGRIVTGGRAAESAERMLSIVSVGSLTLAIGTIGALALLRGRWKLAILGMGAVGTAVLAAEILKLIVLERPDLGVAPGATNSYPSGHATIGMAVGLGVLLVVPPILRWPVGIGVVIFGAAFGTAVVAVGWHRPSDVVGAYLVSLAAAAGFLGLFLSLFPGEMKLENRGIDDERAQETIDRVQLLAMAVLVAGLLGVAGFAIGRHSSGIKFTDDLNAFVLTAVGLAICSALTVGALSIARYSRDDFD